MSKRITHIHQYERRDIGAKKIDKKTGKTTVDNSYIVYGCRLPNCSHYLTPELVIGKLSVCPHCEVAFQLERKHLQLVLPHCDNCKDENHPKVKESKKEEKVKVKSDLGQLFAELAAKGNVKKEKS